ncbi:MAG: SIMPL domain-containing protein [Saccharospirillaceae bacterium]|nr:SIMPL domain-containing protein [Pseudomonadales bacterium]NRB77846.1 SIMPL domain-containing protein [Saccharospirillaceae bacterium]
MKNLSKTILVALTLIATFPLFAGSITVSASSEAEIVPDTAKLILQIRAIEKRTNFARDNVNRTFDRLSFALRPFGISAKNIEKSNVKQGDDYGYANSKRVLNGQYASIDVTIYVDKLVSLQKIYDQIATFDDVRLINTEFEIVNQQAQEDNQLILALKKAKHKAKIMAKAYQQTLGRAISIVEVNSQTMPFVQSRMLSDSNEESGYESVTVKVQVQVEFNLN